jgi:peptidoglycan hydrolase-like protein with peptidoglycan-binding domain
MKALLTNFKCNFRLRAVFVILCALLFATLPVPARAEEPAFLPGDCSDDVLRAETRLSDLGYLTGIVDGLWGQNDVNALAAFYAASGTQGDGTLDSLFSASTAAAQDAFPAASLLAPGVLVNWDEVKEHLIIGQAYALTDCRTGIIVRVVCIKTGGYARFTPELDWDDATLRGFFSSTASSEKLPVAVLIDGVSVAASLQYASVPADGTLASYCIYFSGSVSGVNGIPDVDHEAVVHAAAGG